MTQDIPVQKIIAGVDHAKYADPKAVAALSQEDAQSLEAALYGGIIASGILRINPKSPPPEVQAVMAVLESLRARARGSQVIEPKPEPKLKTRKKRGKVKKQ